jgi:hypothetical protein
MGGLAVAIGLSVTAFISIFHGADIKNTFKRNLT